MMDGISFHDGIMYFFGYAFVFGCVIFLLIIAFSPLTLDMKTGTAFSLFSFYKITNSIAYMQDQIDDIAYTDMKTVQ